MLKDVVDFIKKTYNVDGCVPLHEPRFIGNEKKYINECIDSTFVSSVGKFVDDFEERIAKFTGAKYAIATTNGTSALHISLILGGVCKDTEVITQPLTFIATCNAISYCEANPIFIDVDRETLGLSHESLEVFLREHTFMNDDGLCVNKKTSKVIKACVPMHTFGHPCKIDEIASICCEYNIVLIEDAAESLGSYYKDKHTGTFGKLGILSFNGNKIITSGGGGCIITDDKDLAEKAKYITTTAKMPHKWDYRHNMIGYNYRLPNINAALLCAQLENLDRFIDDKRKLANNYNDFFESSNINFFVEPQNCKSNYWLNAIILADKEERDKFLEETNRHDVMTRPIWTLMNKLEMFKDAECGYLENSLWLEDRVVNIPSSVRIKG
jgi:perosamine synthetase